MAWCIRDDYGNYWSNENGFDDRKGWADFFDDQTYNLPISGHWVRVPDHTAGFYGLKTLMDDFDSGDQYGWCVSWHFALCDMLLFQCGEQPPASWCYKPSPMGKANDDEYKDKVLSRLSVKQLLYVGEILHRYAAILDRAGKSY